MLRKYLCKFFAKIIYPTKNHNWYRDKNYVGSDEKEEFFNFLASQKKPGSHFYYEIQGLSLHRQFIKSGDSDLDSVIITPNKDISDNKPGHGLYFIMFYGRDQYYESTFRASFIQAKETGASILIFNHKGMNQSSGSTEKFADLVSDGISVVDFLLKLGISHKKIILQGNSIGAAVSEITSKHFESKYKIKFRQINSNSFKSIESVIACYYKTPFLEKILKNLLNYSLWIFKPDSDFFKTSEYRCYMRRKNDRTILKKAEYHSMVNHIEDYKNCPHEYKATNKWLNEHNRLIYTGNSLKDPHNIDLQYFKIMNSDNIILNKNAYYFINNYIKYKI